MGDPGNVGEHRAGRGIPACAWTLGEYPPGALRVDHHPVALIGHGGQRMVERQPPRCHPSCHAAVARPRLGQQAKGKLPASSATLAVPAAADSTA